MLWDPVLASHRDRRFGKCGKEEMSSAVSPPCITDRSVCEPSSTQACFVENSRHAGRRDAHTSLRELCARRPLACALTVRACPASARTAFESPSECVPPRDLSVI
eukprot:5398914-Prymnesium_polylepis.1